MTDLQVETISKLTNVPASEIEARIVEKAKVWQEKIEKTL